MATALPQMRAAVEEFSLDPVNSPLPKALGFRPIPHPANLAADATPFAEAVGDVADELYRVGEFEAGAGFYVVRLREWGLRSSDRDRARRRLAKAVVQHPLPDARWLLALIPPQWTDARRRDAEFILPKLRKKKGDVATVRALVNAADPSGFHVRLLADLALAPGMTLHDVWRHWSEAFSVERVTDAFYKDFEALRDRLVETIRARNASNELLGPPEQLRDVNQFVTRQLGRILFVWFLQSKRWLENDERYLISLYERHCRNGDKKYFNDILLTLFFKGLAKPRGGKDRSEDVQELLGGVPYLNGGLFMQNDFEEKLFGADLEHVDIDVPNELFDPTLRKDEDNKEPSVLGLLSSYRFTTRESTPDDMSVDPDPELLGKVFENLNEVQERRDTGTYYTPREVVQFMCREAIDGYLAEETAATQDDIRRIREAGADEEAEGTLDPTVAAELEEAIERIRICDPAVGSGAFLVGAMQELVLLRRGIAHLRGRYHIEGHEVAKWKRHMITENLYGVDINAGAVEICRLRLWLSLVLDLEHPDNEPLPNLDFRIVAGDSLIDRVGDIAFEDSLGGERRRLDERLHNLHAQIAEAKREFQATTHPEHARQRRDKVRRLKREAMLHQLKEHIDQVAPGVEKQRKRVQEFERLGAKASALKKERKLLEQREAQLRQLQEVEEGLRTAKPDGAQQPFLWPVEFPEVFDPPDGRKPGFDVVLANPPYVRQERLSAADQEAYKESFPEVYSGMADLLVFFYARAVQILREGGYLSFITSNSFIKRAYGAGLQRFLAEALTIRTAIDFGETRVFDATVEPFVLVGQKRRPSGEHVVDGHFLFVEIARAAGTRGSVKRVREQLEDLGDLLERDHVGIPQVLLASSGWKLESPEVLRLFERLMNEGTPLGEFVQGRMYRGVLTGLNEAFVIDEAKREELIAADPRSAELIKPWLRGRDIKRWRPEWAGLYVIAIQNSGDPDANNPWGEARTEREARRLFREAYPAIHDHLSEYEDYYVVRDRNGKERRKPGLRPRADQGKWWWELRACAYYEEFEKPKVVWPEFARRVRFCMVDAGTLLNNKCYLWAEPPSWALALLNSQLIEFLLCQITSQLRGSFLQLYDHFVRRLPVVEPDEQTAKLLRDASARLREDPSRQGDESRVEEIVWTLYSVEDEERKLIEDWFKKRSLDVPGGDEDTNED